MMFWKKWKLTKLEKDAVKSLQRAKRIILKAFPKKSIVSIYVGGSFVRREMTKNSDVDIWINTISMKTQIKVSKFIRSYDHGDFLKAGFSGYAMWELRTGKHSKQITKLRTGPMRWLKNLSHYKLIYGKKLKQEDFATKTDIQDLRGMIKAFKGFFLPKLRKKVLNLQDILKQLFWFTDLELKVRGKHPPHSWKQMVKMAPEDHIVREAYKLRKNQKNQDARFIKKLEKHLVALRREFK